MAAEPTVEPTVPREEEQEEYDEGEESDIYVIEDEEGEIYQQNEDEEGDEGADKHESEYMTAHLLGKQNGTPKTEGYEEEEDEEDEDYQQDDEGSEENPIDLSSVVAGSKRGVDELVDGDVNSDEGDEEAEEKTVPKKARV